MINPKTKLELATDMITRSIPSLENYQVVVLCDSWYIKKAIITSIN